MSSLNQWAKIREMEDEIKSLIENEADRWIDELDKKDKEILRLEDEISDLQEDAERTKEYVAKLEQRDYRAAKVDYEMERRKEPRIPVTTEYMEHGPDKADR